MRSPPLHRPLATADDLGRLESRLARSRARFSRLLKGWVILSGFLLLIGLLVATDQGEPATPLVFLFPSLGLGIWVAIRAARVFVVHPRILAVQRQLLRPRLPEAGRSDAELDDEIRQTAERLRRRIAALSPRRPELLQALAATTEAAGRRLGELAEVAVRLARAEVGGDEAAAFELRRAAEGWRADLETCRLALAEVELEAFLTPGFLDRLDPAALRRLFEDQPAARGAADREAHHLYLKGRFFWNKRTPKDIEEAIGFFEQAIAKDPEHALAWAGIADAWNVLGYYSVRAPQEAFSRAEEAAERALAIDPDLAEAHCSLAFARLFYRWDWAGAERSFLRTFELDADYATGHHWYAEYLSFRGRHEEAIAEARTAVELDPLSRILRTILAWTFYYARRYDEAIAQLEEALELDPNFAPAEFWLALAYERRGEGERARSILEKASSVAGGVLNRATLGRVYAALGETEGAQRVLAELGEASLEGYVPASFIAAIHCAGGDREEAFRWLERALEERDNWLVFLGIDPIWDDLRPDPRFAALLAEVGLDVSPVPAAGADSGPR